MLPYKLLLKNSWYLFHSRWQIWHFKNYVIREAPCNWLCFSGLTCCCFRLSGCWCLWCSWVVWECCDIWLLVDNNGNYFSEFNIFGTFWVKNFGNVTFFLHFKVNDGLISFDAAKSVTGLYFIAHLFVPRFDVTLKEKVWIQDHHLLSPWLVRGWAFQVLCDQASWRRRGSRMPPSQDSWRFFAAWKSLLRGERWDRLWKLVRAMWAFSSVLCLRTF